ncbi:MAG: hypothetical protein IKI30_05060 [Oxalobacter sp.]|nr:hypothetical protein [Oxalobacter sp.]
MLFLQLVDRLCPLRQFNYGQIEPVQASTACLCTGKADAPCPYLLVWMRNLEAYSAKKPLTRRVSRSKSFAGIALKNSRG